MFQRRGLGLKAVFTTLVILLLSLGTLGLAAEKYGPMRDSPTSTQLSVDAPLAEAFREAFIGETGVYDPTNGIVQPGETDFPVEIQAAHNGTDIFFKYLFPTPLPSYYHDYLVYQDGEWIRGGRSPVGTEPHGLYEDRITMLVDDGSVKGFANQGGWITCHEDLRDPFMYLSAKNADVQAHPVLGETYGQGDQRKYIPNSRDPGPEWWSFDGWDAVSEQNLERYQERQDHGVFLDLWHWRSHRSNPIGYSDNQYVFETRKSSPGRGPYFTNWDGDAGHPQLMFDPEVSGQYALDWEKVQAQGYDYDSPFFLAQDVNAVAFDPDREWQNGDAIPRRVLRTPAESRGAITADGQLIRTDDGDWAWEVVLRRPMDTGFDQADKQFRPGRTYDAAVAIHRLSTGSRWHFVSLPFTIGIDTPADVAAHRFSGDAPNWEAIEAATLTVIYPGQTSWQWINSDEHPGAEMVREDAMSVIGCHDEIGLGSSNKSIEAYLAGQGPYVGPGLGGPLGGTLQAGNVVVVYMAVAVTALLGAVGIGRIKSSRGRKTSRSATTRSRD